MCAPVSNFSQTASLREVSQQHRDVRFTHILENFKKIDSAKKMSEVYSAEVNAESLIGKAYDEMEAATTVKFIPNFNKMSKFLDLAHESIKKSKDPAKINILLKIAELRLKMHPDSIPVELGEAYRILAVLENILPKSVFEKKSLELSEIKALATKKKFTESFKEALKLSKEEQKASLTSTEIEAKLKQLQKIPEHHQRIKEFRLFLDKLLEEQQPSQQVDFVWQTLLLTVQNKKLSTSESHSLADLQLYLYPKRNIFHITLELAEQEEIRLCQRKNGNVTRLCKLAELYSRASLPQKSKNLFSLAKDCIRPVPFKIVQKDIQDAKNLLRIAEYQIQAGFTEDALESLRTHKKHVIERLDGIQKIVELRKAYSTWQQLGKPNQADEFLDEIGKLLEATVSD